MIFGKASSGLLSINETIARYIGPGIEHKTSGTSASGALWFKT